PREGSRLAGRHTRRAAGRGRHDGTAAAAGRGEDPEGRRRREGARRRARAPAARRGEGPVKILIVAERRDGELRRVTAEMAAKPKSFGDAEVVEVTGTDRYHPVAHANAVAARATSGGADVVLTGATLNGRDLAARVAAKLGWVYAADCTDASVKDGAFEVKRPMYAGKVRATLRLPTPAVLSMRPGAWTLPAGTEAVKPTPIAADAGAEKLKFVRFEPTATSSKRVSLSEARVIVSGGRGLKGPENWKMLVELGDAVGADPGASW